MLVMSALALALPVWFVADSTLHGGTREFVAKAWLLILGLPSLGALAGTFLAGSFGRSGPARLFAASAGAFAGALAVLVTSVAIYASNMSFVGY